MAQISPYYLQIGATVGMLVMALLAIFIRMKASHRPVTIRKILIPPLGMSTGFLMFVVPADTCSSTLGIHCVSGGLVPLLVSPHSQYTV